MKIKNRLLGNLFVLSIFLCAVIIMSYSLVETKLISAQADWLFHASRVEEIYRNIQSGEWLTFISTRTMQKTGVGSFLFYPDIFLYPWALLRLHFSPIMSFYIWQALINFMTFSIAYICMYSYSKSKLRGFIFSLVYTLAPYRLFLGYYVFGEFVANAFIPIAFLGIYEILWRRKNRWYVLAVGMTLIIYSHVLSTFLTVQLLILVVIIWLIDGICNKKIEISRICYIILSAIVTGILTLPIYIPFLTDFIGKGIGSAYPGINVVSMSDIWQNSISNYAINTSIGIILIGVLLTGWYWIKDSKIEKGAYFISLICLVMATSVFPWESFKDTVISAIQLPYRYLVYVILLLSIVASYIIELLCRRYFPKQAFVAIMPIMMVIGMFGYYGSIRGYTHQLENKNVGGVYLTKAQEGELKQIPDVAQLDNDNYSYQFDYSAIYGETDYFPIVSQMHKSKENAESIINNIAKVGNNNIKVSPISGSNSLKYRFSLNKKENVDLPVIAYAHTKVYINNRETKYTISNRGTVELSLNKGKNIVKVTYVPSKYYYYGWIITLSGWLCLIVGLVFWGIQKFRRGAVVWN